jgi:hypothetical protein
LSFYVQRVETENPFSSAIRENPAFQFINGGVQPGIANSSAFNYTPLFGSLGSTFLNKALAVPALSTQAGTGGGQSAEFSLDSVFIGPSERQLSPLRFGDLSDPSSGLSLRGSLRLGF